MWMVPTWLSAASARSCWASAAAARTGSPACRDATVARKEGEEFQMLQDFASIQPFPRLQVSLGRHPVVLICLEVPRALGPLLAARRGALRKPELDRVGAVGQQRRGDYPSHAQRAEQVVERGTLGGRLVEDDDVVLGPRDGGVEVLRGRGGEGAERAQTSVI